MKNLCEILDLSVPLAVVDVGAASMGKGTDPYSALSDDPLVRVVGFEPHAPACDARNATAPPNHRFYPYFVGNGSPGTFHICANPLTSSLFEPNNALLRRFQNLELPVIRRERVDTRRLDDIAEIDACEYLKLDVQGAELDVLRGGERLLPGLLVVHTEVEFIPYYKGQPLFGDIDVFLRSAGFMLHRFLGIFSRQMKPVEFNNDPYSPGSQIIYAEAAVYIRNLEVIDSLTAAQLLKMARIMHDIYCSIDLVAHLLHAHDRCVGSDYLMRYMTTLYPDPPQASSS